MPSICWARAGLSSRAIATASLSAARSVLVMAPLQVGTFIVRNRRDLLRLRLRRARLRIEPQQPGQRKQRLGRLRQDREPRRYLGLIGQRLDAQHLAGAALQAADYQLSVGDTDGGRRDGVRGALGVRYIW